MKFVSAIVAVVAAMAVGSDAAKPKTKQQWKKELNTRMKNGHLDKRTLMKGAKPHSEAAKRRSLDQMEISSYHSVQFVSCFSLTTSYDDIFDNDDGGIMLNLFSQGQILAMQSYAIFRLCWNGSCSGNGNGVMEYVVDMDTYVNALVNYLPNQMQDYCDACQENQQTCMVAMYGYGGNYNNGGYNNANKYQQYNANDNNYNGANVNNVNYGNYGNGQNGGQYGNRKLAKLHEFENRVLKGGQVWKQLDCDLCEEYSCFENDNNNNYNNQNNDMYGFEAASEWLENMAGCAETGIAYNPYGYQNGQQQGDSQLYAGFVCNGDGTGVEIGMFADEGCILYLPNEPYSNYMSYFDQTYVSMTQEIVEFTFSNAVFSCKEEEYLYTTYDMSGYSQYGGQYYNWEEDNGVSEWCAALFEGDTAPTDLNSCGYNGYNGNNGNNQYQNYDQGQQYQYQYDWYRFEITQDNSYDMTEVCSIVKKSEGSLHTFYNTNNGNLYSYTGNSASDTISEFMEDTDNEVDYANYSWLKGKKLSGGAKFGIVALTGIAVGAVVALYLRFKESSVDDKNVGLMDEEETPKDEFPKGEVA